VKLLQIEMQVISFRYTSQLTAGDLNPEYFTLACCVFDTVSVPITLQCVLFAATVMSA